MSPETLANLLSLALGFALAGALTSAYQAFAARPAAFALLHAERRNALAAVPFLVLAAPFLIMRNVLMDRRQHPRRTAFVMMATVLSGFWSLMSGTAFLMLLHATGLLA
jgi:hypothetical protein